MTPSGMGRAAGSGRWIITLIVVMVLAVQSAGFVQGSSGRSAFAWADSALLLLFSLFLMWSLVHGYRWARWGSVYFSVAMVATSDTGLFAFGTSAGSIEALSDLIYVCVAGLLVFAPTSVMVTLEKARTGPYGPDDVLSQTDDMRRGRFILTAIVLFACAAQFTWMVPAWWRAGTSPGLTEFLVCAIIALIAHGLWRRSENARAWAWLFSFGACIWFLALGVFAPEPNDFFIAIGLCHLAIPSALVSWRSVQAYFGDDDLEAKWEYVKPTPRRPKAWGDGMDQQPILTDTGVFNRRVR